MPKSEVLWGKQPNTQSYYRFSQNHDSSSSDHPHVPGLLWQTLSQSPSFYSLSENPNLIMLPLCLKCSRFASVVRMKNKISSKTQRVLLGQPNCLASSNTMLPRKCATLCLEYFSLVPNSSPLEGHKSMITLSSKTFLTSKRISLSVYTFSPMNLHWIIVTKILYSFSW